MCVCVCVRVYLFIGVTAPSGPWPPHSRGFYISHNDVPQSVGLLVAQTSTWQHTTVTTERLPWPGGIRIHNHSQRAAADVRLRPRGYLDRLLLKITVVNPFCDWLQSDFESHKTSWRNALPTNCNLRNMFCVCAAYSYVHSSLNPWNRLRHVILNCTVMWAIT